MSFTYRNQSIDLQRKWPKGPNILKKSCGVHSLKVYFYNASRICCLIIVSNFFCKKMSSLVKQKTWRDLIKINKTYLRRDIHVRVWYKITDHDQNLCLKMVNYLFISGTIHLWRPHGRGVGESCNLSRVCGYYCFFLSIIHFCEWWG